MSAKSKVEIVAASAGSGKTHRLANTLLEEVVAGEVRPEAVVAVTFTVKAAAELEERVRAYLVEKERTADARRLGAARIGTVHGVCARLLSEFAFELGLSPRQIVLDAKAAAVALGESLAKAMTPERARQSADLASRMHKFKVAELAQGLIQQARINAISDEELRRDAECSWQELRRVLGEPQADGERLRTELRPALEEFLRESLATDQTQKSVKARRTVKAALNRLRSGRGMRWEDWVRLARLDTGAASRGPAEGVRQAAADFRHHPQLHADLETAIRLVFAVAADALGDYQRYKREQGAVDFTDQLALALEALRSPVVQQELAGEIDLVLVDEFQDTNPIQLAIFVELSRLAKRSIWVGDQKQAIFAFLQADPALMDAAIEAVLDDEPETLGTSFRSRPELVRLTSAVFAPAFEAVGIPASRTVLEPVETPEPEGLGPVVDRWLLDGPKGAQLAALAAGVKELLDDPDARVRDGRGGTRRPGPADVAVLCRTNSECLTVAEELHALGLESAVERRGLLSAPEVQLVLAGLRRWADPRDGLSAAVLARLTISAGGEHEWLETVLRTPYGGELSEHHRVAAVEKRRSERPSAGLLDVFDEVLEALAVREICVAWGTGEQRLANLEALRALVLAYAGECSARRVPQTIGGFLGWLATVEESEKDGRAQLGGEAAVAVSTYHGAKGLEWPITVLFDPGTERKVSALGVHVVDSDRAFDFADPLAGRWLRLWPNPFFPSQKTFLHEALAEHPVTAALERRQRREALRLIYVAWTRAEDRLILASKRPLDKMLAPVAAPGGSILSEPRDGRAVWAEHQVALEARALTAAPPVLQEPVEGRVPELAGPQPHPAAFRSPSDAPPPPAEAGEPESLGERLSLGDEPDVRVVGEAMHGFLAADREVLSDGERLQLARAIVERWQVEGVVEPTDLALAAERLRAWVADRWPEAVWRREWPVAQRLADGGVVRGFVDLVLEVDEGFVVVDHKTFPGGLEAARSRVPAYAGQLAAYSAALAAATGKEHLGSFIHLPISGTVVELLLG